MKSDFEENNRDNKEYGSSGLDYYNDEISRKAVGRLFEDIEGEVAVSSEGGRNNNADEKVFSSGHSNTGLSDGEGDKPEGRPINNHFYEENRVKEEPEEEGIVRGFDKPAAERRARNPEPRMTVPLSDVTEPRRPVSRRREREEAEGEVKTPVSRTGREEKEKYRTQFLDDMENDRRAARSPSVERPERMSRTAPQERPERTGMPPERPERMSRTAPQERPERTGMPLERPERVSRTAPQERPERTGMPPERADRPRKKPGSLEEYRTEARKPLRPKKPEQEMEELNNAEKRYSRRAQEMEPKIQKAKQAGAPGKRVSALSYNDSDSKADLLSLPIFKVIGAAGIVFLLILIFMGLRMNSLSKELNMHNGPGSALEEALLTIDHLNETIDDLRGQNTALRTENNEQQLIIQSLTGEGEEVVEGESEEGGPVSNDSERTYTVASGDTLSRISQRFYGNPVEGVEKIRSANGLTSDVLQIGQILTIPE